MTDLTTRARLVAALAELGDTAGLVAVTLTRHRITGVPNNGSRCAVVRWLELRVPATTGSWGLYAEGTTAARYWLDGQRLWSNTPGFTPIPVPAPVADFLHAFDGGLYPHLIEAPAVAA